MVTINEQIREYAWDDKQIKKKEIIIWSFVLNAEDHNDKWDRVLRLHSIALGV